MKYFASLALLIPIMNCSRENNSVPENLFRPQTSKHQHVKKLYVEGPVIALAIPDMKGIMLGDSNALAQYLTKNRNSEHEKAMALFEYVSDSVFDWYAPQLKTEAGLTAADMIWRYGFGMCGEKSFTLCELAEAAGIKARLVMWEKHTVCELNVNGKWRLFDPQHRSFFVDSDGNMLGFDEITEKSQLNLINKQGNCTYDPKGYDVDYIKSLFLSAKPRFHNFQPRPNTSFTVDLRPQETLTLDFSQLSHSHFENGWQETYGYDPSQKSLPHVFQGHTELKINSWSQVPWDSQSTDWPDETYTLSFKTPFIFTDLQLTGQWPENLTATLIVGQKSKTFTSKPNQAEIRSLVQGSTQFLIEFKNQKDFQLANLLTIRTFFDIPKNAQPHGQAPLPYQSGNPKFTIEYFEKEADLAIQSIVFDPMTPKAGDETKMTVSVINKGPGISPPSTLKSYQTITGLLLEGNRLILSEDIPPLEPGEYYTIESSWHADNTYTWYDKPGSCQLFDTWLLPSQANDSDLSNNQRITYLEVQPD